MPVVNQQVECGQRGLIILPTMYVTSVDSVIVDGRTLNPPTPDGQVPVAGGPLPEYEWEPTGVIYRRQPSWPLRRMATVSYTHGYPSLPPDVAAVGYELALQAMSRPGANARDIGAGPYRVTLLKLGISMDADQKSRLYDAGVVRPQFA